jgi:dynactin-5
MLGGRTVIMADVQLRGDLHPTRAVPSQSGKDVTPTSISIGRCTVIHTGSIIKPPSRISRGQVHYYPMRIGDNVYVGKETVPRILCFFITGCKHTHFLRHKLRYPGHLYIIARPH